MAALKHLYPHRKGFYYELKAGKRYLWCSCGRSATQPFCDGAHSNLPGGYLTDDPDSAENRTVRAVAAGNSPVVQLDGQCYVFSTSRTALVARGGMAYCAVVSPALGALFQSQFYAEVAEGSSPVISADGRHTVLFVSEGDGEVEISGRRFAVEHAHRRLYSAGRSLPYS